MHLPSWQIKGVPVQPKAEFEALKRSVFALVNVRDRDGRQLRVSGMPQAERRANLATAAERLAISRDGPNRF
ncbi:hypothetical protein [Methylobacterium sp. B1]|uniref:hypothetical protein n=1 Tax=Methylobacterium sp. B1 TaxID=91459 RepID=UPI00034748FD|nr:hypothetical protein [Methylobacterium sp. B1]